MDYQLWYVDYDLQTLDLFRHDIGAEEFADEIFEVTERFANKQGCYQVPADISDWVRFISHATRQMVILLYNFFYVEEKLVNEEFNRLVYFKIHRVLMVENNYTNFFFLHGQPFRLARVTACLLRLSRFLQSTSTKFKRISKNLDKTFLENVNEVTIFIQQKITEILSKTSQLGKHEVNLILIDMLSLQLRISGDTSMNKTLSKMEVIEIITKIQKNNHIKQEFTQLHSLEEKQFEDNCFFVVEDGVQQEVKNQEI